RVSAAVGGALTESVGFSIHVDGRDSIPSLAGGGPYLTAASADYFATLGRDLEAGRAFLPDEGRSSEPVAIVGRSMALALWPDTDALGKCVRLGTADGPCQRIVGVATDIRRFAVREDAALQVYVPLGQ